MFGTLFLLIPVMIPTALILALYHYRYECNEWLKSLKEIETKIESYDLRTDSEKEKDSALAAAYLLLKYQVAKHAIKVLPVDVCREIALKKVLSDCPWLSEKNAKKLLAEKEQYWQDKVGATAKQELNTGIINWWLVGNFKKLFLPASKPILFQEASQDKVTKFNL